MLAAPTNPRPRRRSCRFDSYLRSHLFLRWFTRTMPCSILSVPLSQSKSAGALAFRSTPTGFQVPSSSLGKCVRIPDGCPAGQETGRHAQAGCGKLGRLQTRTGCRLTAVSSTTKDIGSTQRKNLRIFPASRCPSWFHGVCRFPTILRKSAAGWLLPLGAPGAVQTRLA